jgi:ANTAR domain-containing protein
MPGCSSRRLRGPLPRSEPGFTLAEFGAAAVEAGVHSMLSFQLYAYDSGSAGALNLFSQRRVSFDLETEAIGAMLATHAAVAILAMNEHDQFQSALASRDTIGQAKGILMERFRIDAVKAFVMLTKLSQESNIPVREIACASSNL